MTRKPLTPLASLAAISAVLTLSPIPAFAQAQPDAVAPTEAGPPPLVTPPSDAPAAVPLPAPATESAAPAAPATPVYAPASPVVQSVQAQPEEAAPASAPVARTQSRAEAQPTTRPAPAAPASAITPVAPVVTPPSVSAAAAEPAIMTPPALRPAAPDQQVSDTGLAIAIGGGVLLLLGGGITALALRRKPKPADRVRHSQPWEPSNAAGMAEAAPIVAAPQMVVGPEPVAPEPAAPAIMMPVMQRATSDHPQWDQLEAMVAAKPDAANPFLTYRKRMRRAQYLLEHGVPQPLTADQPQQAATAPQRAPQRQAEIKTQPAYAFTWTQPPRRPDWKPATS